MGAGAPLQAAALVALRAKSESVPSPTPSGLLHRLSLQGRWCCARCPQWCSPPLAQTTAPPAHRGPAAATSPSTGGAWGRCSEQETFWGTVGDPRGLGAGVDGVVRPPRRGACGETFTRAERTHNTRVQICIFKAMWGVGSGEGGPGGRKGPFRHLWGRKPSPDRWAALRSHRLCPQAYWPGKPAGGGASQPGAPGNPGPSRRPSRGFLPARRPFPAVPGGRREPLTLLHPEAASVSGGSGSGAPGGLLLSRERAVRGVRGASGRGGSSQSPSRVWAPHPQASLAGRWAAGRPRGWELVAAGGPVSARWE